MKAVGPGVVLVFCLPWEISTVFSHQFLKTENGNLHVFSWRQFEVRFWLVIYEESEHVLDDRSR